MIFYQFFDFFGFIVNIKVINDSMGCFVYFVDFNFSFFFVEFNYYFIQCVDRCDILEMGLCNINDNFFYCFVKIKICYKVVGGGKKYLFGDFIELGIFFQF